MATKNGFRQSLRWIKRASLKCVDLVALLLSFIPGHLIQCPSVNFTLFVLKRIGLRPSPYPNPCTSFVSKTQRITKYKQQKHTDKANQLEVQLVYRVQSHFPKYMIYVYHEGQRGAASARYFVAGSNGSGLMFIWQLIFLNFFYTPL